MNALEIIKKCRKYAVIGLKNDSSKYVYKIYKRLIELNYEVYGVSSYIDELDGVKIYSSLKEVPSDIEVAVFVVNKEKGYNYVDECKVLNIPYLWFQPGTYDDDFLNYLDENKLHYYLNCILRRVDELEKNID